MKRLLIITAFLISCFFSCQAQTQKNNTKEITLNALSKWILNQSKSHIQFDPEIIKHLQDSGRIIDKVKEGLWVEYSVDSSSVKQQISILVGKKEILMNMVSTLQKEIGVYVKNKREGNWVTYKSHNNELPLLWYKEVETEYKKGKKDGVEVLFSLSDTIFMRTFASGKEQGVGKLFDVNHPHNLQKAYYIDNGSMWLLESYFPNGHLQTKYIDSIAYGIELKFFKEYYESTILKMTGFYKNGEDQHGTWTKYYKNKNKKTIENFLSNKLNGSYKYFHDNGQLWTERIYRDGKPWNVISNFDKTGKMKDSGTLKNGTGTLNFYDSVGNLTEVIEYVNGIEK